MGRGRDDKKVCSVNKKRVFLSNISKRSTTCRNAVTIHANIPAPMPESIARQHFDGLRDARRHAEAVHLKIPPFRHISLIQRQDLELFQQLICSMDVWTSVKTQKHLVRTKGKLRILTVAENNPEHLSRTLRWQDYPRASTATRFSRISIDEGFMSLGIEGHFIALL